MRAVAVTAIALLAIASPLFAQNTDIEFVLTRAPVAIRAGWWHDPAHAIAYRGPVVTPEEVAAHILFPGGRDENHFSAGIGVAWPRFQVDAAYDTSEPRRRRRSPSSRATDGAPPSSRP
jgi:hypothetical protein